MAPTIKNVAKKAGVSETTVSLAFREKSRISKKTRDKVINAASEIGYMPNLAAKNLRSGAPKTIGFIVNDITNPFYSLMMREAEDIALQHGYSVIFAGSNWSEEKERHLFEQMVQMRVNGLIVCLCEKSAESVGMLDRFKIPYIAVDSYPDWYKGAYVANDFRQAGTMAAMHLFQQGCRNPAYFTAGKEMKELSAFMKMERYFAEYFRINKVDFGRSNVIEAGLSIRNGHEAFDREFQRGKRFDGIFCVNDLCAMGVMEAASESGVVPGRDLAIVGIDDTEVSAFSRVSLSSIRQPYSQIAKIAMESLLESADSGVCPDIRVELPAEFIVRNSSKLFK
ncbi:MAG: hypothetical protein A2020_04965 [Lentisphaerae bacterium GWF2_45_14]|nr:MAG: hypothetical protein A2020_04965 [Lentisphaerae bacterium GWF2_45_14]